WLSWLQLTHFDRPLYTGGYLRCAATRDRVLYCITHSICNITEESTTRTKFRRKPSRGSHDRATIEAILDEALVSHLGFLDDGLPVVIPTLHVRVGSHVYLHGSAASRALRESKGAEVCLTATLVDGLVLA